MTETRNVVVAITGASGACLGVRILQLLRERPEFRTHLVLSKAGILTLRHECDLTVADVRALADVTYRPGEIGATIASGSFPVAAMLVAPCSVKTLSGIANSYNDELVVRAADVCLKERRRVVLMLRETPLHAGHIELMARATNNGAIIMPPVPAFYTLPRSLEDVVDQTVARALELLDVVMPGIQRWDGRSVVPDEG